MIKIEDVNEKTDIKEIERLISDYGNSREYKEQWHGIWEPIVYTISEKGWAILFDFMNGIKDDPDIVYHKVYGDIKKILKDDMGCQFTISDKHQFDIMPQEELGDIVKHEMKDAYDIFSGLFASFVVNRLASERRLDDVKYDY